MPCGAVELVIDIVSEHLPCLPSEGRGPPSARRHLLRSRDGLDGSFFPRPSELALDVGERPGAVEKTSV